MQPPSSLNELPENMIRLPAGETAQFWPSDMRKDVKVNIQSPIFMQPDSTSYGYYTAFITNHADKTKKTAPMVFPSPTPTPRSKTKVISLSGDKVKAAASSVKPTKFTHWDGMKMGKSAFKWPAQVSEPQNEPHYTEFYPIPSPCIPTNQYTFQIYPNPKFLPLASALRSGNIAVIKELARQLQEDILVPQPALQPTIMNEPVTFPPVTTTEAPPPTSSKAPPPPPYTAPNKKIARKRINRRPRPNLRELQRTRVTTTTDAVSATQVTTEVVTSTQPSRRRISRFYIFE